MTIASTLREYLADHQIEYDIVSHPYTAGSLQTAESAHVPGDQLAKSVLLEDKQGYVMAVVPASHHVELDKLRRQTQRDLDLATENDISNLFDDCETGAIPPVGDAYGIDAIYDDRLAENSDIFFEAGDHTGLVHMSGRDFQDLIADAQHGDLSHYIY